MDRRWQMLHFWVFSFTKETGQRCSTKSTGRVQIARRRDSLAISRARMYFARLTIAIAEIIATTRSLQWMRFFLMKTKFYYLIYNSWHSSVYGIYQLVLLGIQSLDSVSFLPGWEEALWKLSSFYVSKQKPKKFRCCKKKCHRTNKTQAALFFDAAYLKKLLQSFAFLHFIDKESEMTLVSSTT